MNIEIPDFLIEMSERLNSEDCRSTSHPFWQVRYEKYIPTAEDLSDEYRICDLQESEDIFHSTDERQDDDRVLLEHLYGNYESWCKERLELTYTVEEVAELGGYKECFLSEYCADDFMHDLPDELTLYYVQKIEEIVHTCLTEEDADAFIKRQQHNYPKLYTYVESAHNSPEIRQLRAWIKQLTKGYKEEYKMSWDLDAMSVLPESWQDELIFVGYTNGHQILYATEAEGGEGFFYSNTDGDSYIPLYMLKSHAHRLQTTSNMNVTLDKLKRAQNLDA